MAGRNSRKRTAPARLREETWYLVKYEEDENLRVLGQEDIQHIFPDEEDDCIDVGDIVSAIWLPNGQFYDAKVLQKGNDKNELMKERMRLEKTKKNNEKTMEEDPKQKRKNDKDGTEEKKKKRKLGDEAQSSTETNQKAKEKEDRKKKKEEEQRRKNFLLETRKAQAAQRWSSIASRSESSTTKTTFSPVPLRNANNPQVHLPVSSDEDMSFTCTLPASHDVLQTNQPQANTPTSVQQTPSQHTTPSQCSSSTGSTTSRSLYRTPAQRTTASQSTPAHDTPKAPAGRKQCPDPRRGIHFQSALGDMGEDDDSEESDTECSGCVATESNSCGGCRELRIENEELRKRLEKVHKRLNIALKAKTGEEVTKNRPSAGVVDKPLAEEYKMIKVMEGGGVFWYAHQRAYCSALKSWQSYINAAIDMFFTKETLAASCAMGNEKKSSNGAGHQPLNAAIIQSIIGKVCSKFSKDGPSPSQVVQKINMKCVEARRPPRHRAIYK